MPPARVMLLRAAAWALMAGGLATPAALASTGGAKLPSGVTTTDAAPAPSTPDDDAVAEPVALEPQVAAMPVLENITRGASDPVTTDLAALGAPSNIAAVDGHVVVVRQVGPLSELVDLQDPGSPRVLLASTRVFGTPLAGHDAAGNAVVVASPCAGSPAVVQLGQRPKCPLRAVDLTTALSRPLAGTTGAIVGDLGGTHLVFTRSSPQTGVRLYEAIDGGAVHAAPLPVIGTTANGWTASSGRPAPGTLRVGEFDVDAGGRLALVLEYASTSPKFSSGLWLRSAAGAWRRVTAVNTGFAGMGTRHVLGPLLDATGVTGYVEGVVETPSFLGHWSNAGAETTHTSIRRSIGRTTILEDAAYDSGRLLFVDWLPGAPCGSEGALACGLRTVGPITVK